MRTVEMMIFDIDRVAIFRSPCSCVSREGGVRYRSNITPWRDIDGPIHCMLLVEDSDTPLVSFHTPRWIRFPAGRQISIEMRSYLDSGPPSLSAPPYEPPESSAWIVQD